MCRTTICSLICYSLFKNYNVGNEIGRECSQYIRKQFSGINNIIILKSWYPNLKHAAISTISCKISNVLKEHKYPVLKMNGYHKEYIAKQLPNHISICLFRQEIVEFSLIDIEIDTPSSGIIRMEDEDVEKIRKYMTTFNNGTKTINLQTTDPVEVEILSIKFQRLIMDTVNIIDYDKVITLSYESYLRKKQAKDQELEEAINSYNLVLREER